jgi:acetylglutamate kinase
VIHLIKIGGNIIDKVNLLKDSLTAFHNLEGVKILIHGGGKISGKVSEILGVSSYFFNGRRITDDITLDIVTMVYAGLINKKIVCFLQSLDCPALGLSGADGNFIKAFRRPLKEINYGNVGNLSKKSLNLPFLNLLLENGFIPVMCSLPYDGNGGLLNSNADNIAANVAESLILHHQVSLHYVIEKKGVLLYLKNDNSFIHKMDENTFQELKKKKVIADGMISKLESAFLAIKAGVTRVKIGIFRDKKKYGTILTLD